VALITGAAGGLGSALAKQLARAGSDLLLVDKNTRALESLSDELIGAGLPEPGICTMDLATAVPGDYDQLAAILRDEYKGMDAFIHCAVAFGGLQPMEQIAPAQWQECFTVNLMSAVQIICICGPMLRSDGGGKVVLIQDNAKVSSSAYWGPYGVSKAALSSLAAILSEELEEGNLELIRITPEPMRTDLRARAYLAEDPNTIASPEQEASRIVSLLGRDR